MRGWAIDPNVSGPITVAVYDNGYKVTDLRAGTNRPDVGTAFGVSAAHGFDERVTLGDGVHNLCAFAINDGPGGSPLIGCASASITGSPIGNFERISRDPNGVRVSGWSIDPDAAGAVSIRVSVDGGTPTVVAANGTRPDVGAVYPGNGPDHGFNAVVPAGSGNHQVCVTALNLGGSGADKSLGCAGISITSNPFGNLDWATPTQGGLDIGGWAIDPDTSNAIDVEVYVDNAKVTTISASAPRPDVNAAFPAYPGNHGYTGSVPVGPGSHVVCTRAVNVGAGTSTLLACRNAGVTGLPFGHLDGASRSGSTAALAGWAIDPDTVNAIDVHYYVDGAFGGVVRAGDLRADVGTVYPAFGAAHGYAFSVPVGSGTHQICVYSINAGPPAANPLQACATV
jgi:hypothetical protein